MRRRIVQAETRDTIPFWLAVAITVCVSLPFGTWLGNWNLPIWVSFIVWAEYFVFGARLSGLRIIVPAYVLGVVSAALILTGYTILTGVIGDVRIATENDLAMFVAMFVGFCALVYAMKWFPITETGTLPFYNGISMTLAVYFTRMFEGPFGADLDAILTPVAAGVIAALAGLLGTFLGWFNVAILFPRKVGTAHSTGHQAAGI
jgi:hypothetical protein